MYKPKSMDRRSSRIGRLTAGGVSVPLAIIINHMLVRWDISFEDPSMQIAMSTLIGSIVTVMVLCFNDIRAVVMSVIHRRRSSDRR